jgi:hypothetical protein
MLVTNQGVWKNGALFGKSDGLTKGDVIAVSDDRVITTRGVFYGQGGDLNPYK